jgi:hypothetical protein
MMQKWLKKSHMCAEMRLGLWLIPMIIKHLQGFIIMNKHRKTQLYYFAF